MNNNDWMLATAHRGNNVVNELYETNSKVISMAETISQSRSACLKETAIITSLSLLISKKYRAKDVLQTGFYLPFNTLLDKNQKRRSIRG